MIVLTPDERLALESVRDHGFPLAHLRCSPREAHSATQNQVVANIRRQGWIVRATVRRPGNVAKGWDLTPDGRAMLDRAATPVKGEDPPPGV